MRFDHPTVRRVAAALLDHASANLLLVSTAPNGTFAV